MRLGWLWIALVACHRDDAPSDTPTEGDADADADSDTDADTDPVPTGDVSCAIDPDNALRAICDVGLDAPADVVVTFTAEGEAPIVRRSTAPAATHRIVVWGLVPDTTFAWEVAPTGGAPVRGQLDVPPLAGSLNMISVAVSDTGPHGDEAVLFNYTCDNLRETLLIIDRQGRVRWYQNVDALDGDSPGPNTTRGYNVTPTGTIVAVLDRDFVAEVALDGSVPLLLQRGPDFTQPVHHDVFRWGAYTYAVFSEQVTGPLGPTVMDGFYVFDAAGAKVGEWHMFDHFEPTLGGTGGGAYWGDEFPGAFDWSHTNAIAVGPDGDATLSLRYQNALLHVSADPTAPDFGEVRWVLVGDEASSALTSTIDLVSSAGLTDPGFAEQHAVMAVDADTLTLWDNGDDQAAGSRMLRLELTGDAVDAAAEWPAGSWCPGQGSARLLPSGNALLDCAPADTLAEVTPTGEAVWSASVRCDFGIMLRPLYRGLPIDLFPEEP